MSKVAYIVVGWNNIDILQECFDSIREQTYEDKLIIYVDNNSADESVAFVGRKYPEVKILGLGANTGFAKGNNLGIKEVMKDEKVQYTALVNSDARLDKEWTTRLVDFSKQKPKGAMFQGLTLDYYDRNVIDSTHTFVSHNGQATQGNWRHYCSGQFGPKKVFGVNAAACLITRKFLEAQPFGHEVFDERMFMYLEDVDLAARSTIMGWDNYSVPDAIAYHMGSASSGKNPGFSLYMTFRNNSGMLFKNFPMKLLLRMLPNIVRSDIDTFRHLRRKGRQAASWKMLQGRIVGLWYMPYYSAKRRALKQHKDIDVERLWKQMKRGY